jgi:NitT/TauT family transport system substrate-binding protein
MMEKRRHRGLVILALALSTAIATGCGSSSGSQGSSGTSGGQVAIRMQLSWTPEAEFAGYLVAKAKGYYSQAGLNVTILPGGPNVNDIQQLVTGAADVTVDRTSTLFQAWAKGIPIKAIAETDAEPQIWLVARKSSGITKPSDLKGKRIGIYSDDAFIVDTMLKNMGISLNEAKVFFQGFNVNGFIANKYPVSEVYLTSDLVSILEAGIKENQLTIFKPANYGAGIIHGVLIATDKIIQSHPAALTKFVQATLKGWEYAYAHPYQAISIVLAAAGSSGGTRAYQTTGLAEMKNIQWPNGTKPTNWGTIPLSIYEQNAKVVEASSTSSGGTGGKPINVADTMDTSITSGKG